MAFFSENLALPDNAFLILRNLIMERTGIYFEDDKKDMLADKLSDRVIEKGFNSFIDYYYLLKYDKDNPDEWNTVLDLVTVKETYFWREADHIEALVKHIVPEFETGNSNSVLRIWSAACSTGEEPLSLVMALDSAGWLKKIRVELIASDASRMALEKARKGLFREKSFKSLPEKMKKKYFVQEGAEWRIKSEILDKVRWEQINLVDDNQRSLPGNVNVIFCRNMFIYMKEDHIRRILEGFYSQLLKPGYLFVGVSESLFRIRNKFELTELDKTFVYKKE
ncbi:MAG TPA: protein-glutamate O-methyltransferase CheR [Bacteroidales bacterium]|nr:protein-glutamate O-methyltransferase CheR [Bacteroidales bacterium]